MTPHRARSCRDAQITYGDASRDHFAVGLDGADVRIDGTLWDRCGPALSFGEYALRFHTRVVVDCGVLPDGFDGAWSRNYE